MKTLNLGLIATLTSELVLELGFLGNNNPHATAPSYELPQKLPMMPMIC